MLIQLLEFGIFITADSILRCVSLEIALSPTMMVEPTVKRCQSLWQKNNEWGCFRIFILCNAKIAGRDWDHTLSWFDYWSLGSSLQQMLGSVVFPLGGQQKLP